MTETRVGNIERLYPRQCLFLDVELFGSRTSVFYTSTDRLIKSSIAEANAHVLANPSYSQGSIIPFSLLMDGRIREIDRLQAFNNSREVSRLEVADIRISHDELYDPRSNQSKEISSIYDCLTQKFLQNPHLPSPFNDKKYVARIFAASAYLVNTFAR